jgi:phosphoribosylformylglycinamidine synthase
MKFQVQIQVMPLAELLDPQGKAVTESLHQLGLTEIEKVRIGKNISLSIEAASEAEARQKTELACEKLLANAVMESFDISLSPAS